MGGGVGSSPIAPTNLSQSSFNAASCYAGSGYPARLGRDLSREYDATASGYFWSFRVRTILVLWVKLKRSSRKFKASHLRKWPSCENGLRHSTPRPGIASSKRMSAPENLMRLARKH